MPEKGAVRDVVHGLSHLEEIAEGWLCASRTIEIISQLATKWDKSLPDTARGVIAKNQAVHKAYLGIRRGSDQAPSRDRKSPSAKHGQHPVALASDTDTFTNTLGSPTTDTMMRFANISAPSYLSRTQPVPYSNKSSGQQGKHYDALMTSGGYANDQPSPKSLVELAKNSPIPMSIVYDPASGETYEWWLREHAGLETGFDNWSGMDFAQNPNVDMLNQGFQSIPGMSVQESAYIGSLLKNGSTAFNVNGDADINSNYGQKSNINGKTWQQDRVADDKNWQYQ